PERRDGPFLDAAGFERRLERIFEVSAPAHRLLFFVISIDDDLHRDPLLTGLVPFGFLRRLRLSFPGHVPPPRRPVCGARPPLRASSKVAWQGSRSLIGSRHRWTGRDPRKRDGPGRWGGGRSRRLDPPGRSRPLRLRGRTGLVPGGSPG